MREKIFWGGLWKDKYFILYSAHTFGSIARERNLENRSDDHLQQQIHSFLTVISPLNSPSRLDFFFLCLQKWHLKFLSRARIF